MKNKLTKLFDFQKFENRASLAALIEETEKKYRMDELSDDDLSTLNAAGTPAATVPKNDFPED